MWQNGDCKNNLLLFIARSEFDDKSYIIPPYLGNEVPIGDKTGADNAKAAIVEICCLEDDAYNANLQYEEDE